MKRLRLGRRALLHGLGGAAAALPALEITRVPEAKAQSTATPKRFVLMYAGVSTGTDASSERPMIPATVGPGYTLGRALSPLGSGQTAFDTPGYGVQDDVTLVSGLRIPWADADCQEPPPGGRSPGFHYNTVGPQLSGVRGRAQRTGEPRGSHRRPAGGGRDRGGHRTPFAELPSPGGTLRWKVTRSTVVRFPTDGKAVEASRRSNRREVRVSLTARSSPVSFRPIPRLRRRRTE